MKEQSLKIQSLEEKHKIQSLEKCPSCVALLTCMSPCFACCGLVNVGPKDPSPVIGDMQKIFSGAARWLSSRNPFLVWPLFGIVSIYSEITCGIFRAYALRWWFCLSPRVPANQSSS